MGKIGEYTISGMQKPTKKKGGGCISKGRFGVRTKLKRLTIKEMDDIAKERGGECLSRKYINAQTKLKWRCKFGHTWEAKPCNIKRGSWCARCAGNTKYTLKQMRDIAEERGGKCLSKKYINGQTKLKWRCKFGHTWEAKPSSVIRGAWCSDCSTSLGERICRMFFENIFNEKFPKSRPKWLKNKYGNQLELDGYCKKLKLAFEHQGGQHSKRREYTTKKQFKKLCDNDIEKKLLCKKYGITLITLTQIPEKTSVNKLRKLIITECEKEKYPHVPKEIKRISNLSRAYQPMSETFIAELKREAKKRGGKCLSGKYIGAKSYLQWQCKKGHIWKAAPYNIKSGKWCPYCAGNKKHTIEDMRLEAKRWEGKCLSKKYHNQYTKLRWMCKKGHVWETPPASVRCGHWCPYCARNEKLTMREMYMLAQEKGGKCLSRNYVNARTKLKWQCKEGHIWESTPDHVKNGKWCKKCGIEEAAKKRRIGIEKMKEIAEKKGGKCLSDVYINIYTKLKWKCKKNHVWETKPVNVYYSGYWCPECGKSKRLTIDQMNIDAKKRGGKCLSKAYVNNHTKLKWQCAKGHIWESDPMNIRAGNWCPICHKKKTW